MTAGLVAGGFAAAVFALCFIVAFLYIARTDERAPTHPRARRDDLHAASLLGPRSSSRSARSALSPASTPTASSSPPFICVLHRPIVILLFAFRQPDPRRDSRLLRPAAPAARAAAPRCRSRRSQLRQRCALGHSSARPRERASGLLAGQSCLRVAPSEVQTRTMSRIERMPTTSPSSKTTRWRTPRRDISAAASLEAPVGGGGDHPLAHVVGDQLDVRVLAGADREQQIALGDDPRRRRLVVDDQRRADALRRPSSPPPGAACATGPPSPTPPTCHPSPASRPPLDELSKIVRIDAKTTRNRRLRQTLSGGLDI